VSYDSTREDQADVENTSTGTNIVHQPHLPLHLDFDLDTDRLCNSRTLRTWLPRIVNIKNGGDIAFWSPPAEHVRLGRMLLQKSMPASSGYLTTLRRSSLDQCSSDLRRRDDWMGSTPGSRITEPQTTRRFDFVQAGYLHLVVRTCPCSSRERSARFQLTALHAYSYHPQAFEQHTESIPTGIQAIRGCTQFCAMTASTPICLGQDNSDNFHDEKTFLHRQNAPAK
jgi:hypothetical protein